MVFPFRPRAISNVPRWGYRRSSRCRRRLARIHNGSSRTEPSRSKIFRPVTTASMYLRCPRIHLSNRFACEVLLHVAHNDLVFVRKYEALATPVTSSEHGNVTVEVKVIPEI